MNNKTYDLVIIGNGPAGITAAVYAARYKINQIIVGDMPGGLVSSAHKICNFPTYTDISGMELTQKFIEQLTQLQIPQIFDRVQEIHPQPDHTFSILLSNHQQIISKTILLAIGTKHRHLNLAKENEFLGNGLSYCATCDGMLYKNKTIAIVGGSDSANTSALYLSQIADQVYQIYRGSSLRGDPTWIEQIHQNSRITTIYNTNIVELLGQEKLTGVKLDQPYQQQDILKIDGLFIEIGSEPDISIIQNLSISTQNNY
ncbi:MAG TPA: FAD-dependent oxidoreductase, partial [bacterium]|nr:FAD-dependent oxidoreductase [bacterium]